MLDDVSTIESIFKATGGVPVEFGGVVTWGHLESWPEELGMQGETMTMIVSENSVVIAADSLPSLGVHPVDGAEGVDERITVGDYQWVVRGVTKASVDGRELRVWLTG